jgi:integral membrane protein (TIGR01906 family)
MIFRTLRVIARIIFIACVPLILFSAAAAIAFNCVSLYEYSFDKYDAVSTTGIDRTELVEAAKTLISFFNSSDEQLELYVEKNGIEIELYTREEAIHMKDVRGLLRQDYGILLITLFYVLVYAGVCLYRRKYGRQIAWNVLIGSGVTIALMLALWLGALWDFDRLFYHYHLIAFSNDYWSAKGYMLQLFPGGFWYDAVLFCALGIAITALVAGSATGGYLVFRKKGLHFHRQVS